MSNGNGVPEASVNPRKWQSLMSKEERVRICRHIMYKLASFYRSAPEESLKERTRTFEAHTFNSSASRDDYLNSIAHYLANIEERLSAEAKAEQHQLPNQQLPNQQLPNQQLPNQQLPNQQLPNQHLPNQQFPNQQLPNQQLPNQQLPSSQQPSQQPSAQPPQQ